MATGENRENSDPRADEPVPLRGVRELAELLGVSDDLVYQCVNTANPAQYWPHHRIGRRIRFTDSDIDAILAKTQHHPPLDREALMDEAKMLRAMQRLRKDRAQ
jgi:excisionase family DNA binding protein